MTPDPESRLRAALDAARPALDAADQADAQVAEEQAAQAQATARLADAQATALAKHHTAGDTLRELADAVGAFLAGQTGGPAGPGPAPAPQPEVSAIAAGSTASSSRRTRP